MICVKIHKSYRDVIALCDSELVGKKFEEGVMQLDLRENFYKEKEVTYDEAVQLIQFQTREDATFNIVGKNSINAAKEAGILTDEGVKEIQGIPFSLVLV
ncbi:hypothetical protein COU60_05345 [Candidatus Pacearchaeota archaeon CG10_big_fil_rev_8_21_14_0_10_34_76]|nr:MAG: hypothetical protein COU60_05345 [Candidatus Pacearchaeota archaeon CG10_big_fil_rev_8_21_14_0_10_34_76]